MTVEISDVVINGSTVRSRYETHLSICATLY
jgi:hypothetical protein